MRSSLRPFPLSENHLASCSSDITFTRDHSQKPPFTSHKIAQLPCNEKFQRSLSSLVGVADSEESCGSSSDDLRWNPSGESSSSFSSSPLRKKETTRHQKISLLLSPRQPTRQDSNKSLGETNTAKLLEEEGVKKHSNTFLLREPEHSLCSLLQLSRRNRFTGDDEVGSDPLPVPDRAQHQRISDLCCDLLDD